MKFKTIIKAVFVVAVLLTVAFTNINPVMAKSETDPVLDKYSKMGTLFSGKLDNISTTMLYFEDRGFALSKDIRFFSKYGDQIGADNFGANLNVDFVVGPNRKVLMVKKR